MIELDDPVSAATGAYLAAAMGDMAGREDVFDDIEQARALAGVVKDPIILGQLLLLEARVLRRTRDVRARSTLEAAIEDLGGEGSAPTGCACRAAISVSSSWPRPITSVRPNISPLALPVLLRLDRSASALACGGLAVLAIERGDVHRGRKLAHAAQHLLQPDAPTSAEDKERLSALLPASTGSPAAGTIDDAEILELAVS